MFFFIFNFIFKLFQENFFFYKSFWISFFFYFYLIYSIWLHVFFIFFICYRKLLYNLFLLFLYNFCIDFNFFMKCFFSFSFHFTSYLISRHYHSPRVPSISCFCILFHHLRGVPPLDSTISHIKGTIRFLSSSSSSFLVVTSTVDVMQRSYLHFFHALIHEWVTFIRVTR